MRGCISDIQRFSLHDGPGIRTTVFLKGCLLRCSWCHNPESMRFGAQIRYEAGKCMRCGDCAREDSGAAEIIRSSRLTDASDAALQCAQMCPTGAMKRIGEWREAAEVVKEVLADQPYFEASGGGVTLSGGDPLAQAAFSAELLKLFRSAGISTAMETALYASAEAIDGVMPLVDWLYCDIKLADAQAHRRYTGVSNEMILENIMHVAARGQKMVVRTPLIPGITATRENIQAIGRWLGAHAPEVPWQLLNYNPLARAKWGEENYAPGNVKPYSPAEMDAWIELGRQQGVRCFDERGCGR